MKGDPEEVVSLEQNAVDVKLLHDAFKIFICEVIWKKKPKKKWLFGEKNGIQYFKYANQRLSLGFRTKLDDQKFRFESSFFCDIRRSAIIRKTILAATNKTADIENLQYERELRSSNH